MIYKNWYLNVYEPIQREICKNMASPCAENARTSRYTRYLEYLEQVNRHGSVYQDDFEPAEYDPTNLINLDASVQRKLDDPTNLPQRKQFKELSMVNSHLKLPTITKVESPRSHVVWNNWLLDQYNSIESNVRAKSA